MKRLFVLGFTALALILVQPATVAAFEYRVPDAAGNLSIGADETPKDLYVAGGTVDIRANTTGDLVVAGGVLELSGRVEDDLLAAGGTVTVSGDVGDTVRIGGGNVRIAATIAGDLIVGAGTVVITPDAQIKGDLVVGSGVVTVSGPVGGDIRAAGGSITLASEVGGDVLISDAETVTVDSTAAIGGALTYSALKPAVIAEGASITGKTTYTELKQVAYTGREFGATQLTALATAAGLMAVIGRVIMVSILALVLLAAIRPVFGQVVKTAYANFWSSVGLGLATLIVSPIVLMMLLITVVGAMLAGAGFLVYGLLLLAAKAMAVAVFGAGLYRWIGNAKDWPVTWQTIVVGALALELVTLVPFLGWFVGVVVFCMTLGALVLSLRSLNRA